MATSEVAQEIADLTPEPVEPVAAQEKPSRLQARIDRFVSTIKQQGQQIAKQQEQIARLEAGDFAGLLTEQRNEITKLTLERGELLDRVRQHHQRAKRAETRWEVERQISGALNGQLERYDQLSRDLKQGLERALILVEHYQKPRPITPNPDRYTKGTK